MIAAGVRFVTVGDSAGHNRHFTFHTPTFRPALEMSGELLDRVEIRRDGRGGEVTALAHLQHDLATMGHKTPPVTHTLPGGPGAPHAERPPRQRLGPNGVFAGLVDGVPLMRPRPPPRHSTAVRHRPAHFGIFSAAGDTPPAGFRRLTSGSAAVEFQGSAAPDGLSRECR